MRIVLAIILLFALFLPHYTFAQSPTTPSSYIAEAQVISIKNTGKINNQNHKPIKQVQLKILTGPLKNTRVTTRDNTVSLPYQLVYKEKDHVIVTISQSAKSNTIHISDYDRKPALLLLIGLFIALTLFIARKQGIMSLLGMLISFYVIVQIVIPNILAGANAFTITLLGALIIIPSTYYLAHGFNKKTTIAMVGTFITLLLVALLSYFFSSIARLTGYSSEEAVFLQSIYGSTINIVGLLIAGMLIGALAVLNDITISQASIVASLRKSNHKLTFKELYTHAMDVGKDHVASLVNTLILVYVGAALPLVLLFYNTHTPLSLLLNQEIIATEIVRTFVASIGIIAAVPITTYLACLFADKS